MTLEKTKCKWCGKYQMLYLRHSNCKDKNGKTIERIMLTEDVLKENKNARRVKKINRKVKK